MKKIYLIIFTLAFFHFAKAQNPVPNSSFENWTSGNPNGWTTSNNSPYITITQVMPGYNSTNAAQGQPVVASSYIIPPVLSAQFSVSQAYNNLQFYYKSNLVDADAIIVQVYLQDAGGDDLDIASYKITNNDSAFRVMEISIPDTGGTPAMAEISFEILDSVNPMINAHPASYFIVDDVSLNIIAGVEEITAGSKINIYPVPAHNWLTVKGQTGNNKPVNMVLTDVTGRVVLEKKSETSSGSFIDEQINLNGFAPGIYSLALISDESVLTRKIVIQ